MVKVRVYAYRDGKPLPEGFEMAAGKGAKRSYQSAWLECLLALCGSVGLDVCLVTDEAPGDVPDGVAFTDAEGR